MCVSCWSGSSTATHEKRESLWRSVIVDIFPVLYRLRCCAVGSCSLRHGLCTSCHRPFFCHVDNGGVSWLCVQLCSCCFHCNADCRGNHVQAETVKYWWKLFSSSSFKCYKNTSYSFYLFLFPLFLSHKMPTGSWRRRKKFFLVFLRRDLIAQQDGWPV